MDTFSKADDAELSMKPVAEFNYVRVRFDKETHAINKRNLPIKEGMARINDPHDSVYTVDIDDDDDENDIREKSYYKSNTRRIKKKLKEKYDSSDDRQQ